MLDTLLRKRCSPILTRFFLTTLKSSYSDAVVNQKPKLKDLVEEDSVRAQKKDFQPYFVERLFANKFQADLLTYPQLDTIEEVKALKSRFVLTQKLLDDDNANPGEIDSGKAVSTLKSHELTGFKVPRIKSGFGYLNSEYVYLQEAMASDPSLGKTINEQEYFGVYLINEFGSDIQKEQYLLKLARGESIAGFANIEEDTVVSIRPDSLKTTAILDKESYKISGKKCWVYNAKHVDLFIVNANIISDNGQESKSTLFLVDKSLPGIEIHEPTETIGLKNLSIYDVTFNNVIVPSSCVLGSINEGEVIINKALSQGVLNNGGLCIGLMKKLLNAAVNHCIFNEFFKKAKYKVNYFKSKVAVVASRIYTVESMTYLLTGRLDSHNNGDVFLESLIIKIFASEALRLTVKDIQDILGPEFLLNDNLMNLSKDCHFYVACDDTNNDFRKILSTLGLKYAVKYKKERNIMELFSDIFNCQTLRKIVGYPVEQRLAFSNVLNGYVHNMFHEESCLLEDSVFCLREASAYLVRKYGENIIERHLELKHLADMVINIYSMAATLSRASRSFCISVKYQEFDRQCCETIIRYSCLKVRNSWNFIMRNKSPLKLPEIASNLMKSGKYSKYTSVFDSLKVPS